ncbi:hypothetical protein P171DRAFT_82907 [Karstenula rhodostoma CBS 690.94]|uniref:Uncharacterized protein n=1 Tax=Karstenula rhodostoma CBS 690.94 TaxID=1392251 RepID=A0A9P4PFE5_9PLEO|nr:hypothetical protein P171DRAFT_82907 [Karstenula rhodostoma CBS 690.94]
MPFFTALSCLVLSCLVLSCLVLSGLVLSCLVLSCRVLSGLRCVSPHRVREIGLYRRRRKIGIRLSFFLALLYAVCLFPRDVLSPASYRDRETVAWKENQLTTPFLSFCSSTHAITHHVLLSQQRLPPVHPLPFLPDTTAIVSCPDSVDV